MEFVFGKLGKEGQGLLLCSEGQQEGCSSCGLLLPQGITPGFCSKAVFASVLAAGQCWSGERGAAAVPMRSARARSQPCSRALPEMRLPQGLQNPLVYSPPVSYSSLLDVLFRFWNLPFYFIFFILLALLLSTYFSSRSVYSNTSFKRQFCWSSQWIILACREGKWGNCCRCWGERPRFLSPSWRPFIEGIRGTAFYFLFFYFFSFFQVKKKSECFCRMTCSLFLETIYFFVSLVQYLYMHVKMFLLFFLFSYIPL